jgi:3-dehydroquinate synthase
MIVPIHLKNSNSIEYVITINKLPTLFFKQKVAIVTNSTVANLHLKGVLKKIKADSLTVVMVPDGEKFKTLNTVVNILDNLFKKELDRKSLLVAFGGGVIGDMTGFVASIYQRGIEFIQIPTTLLSQVDASVGGKTGVNNRFGKNLIGTFYQPKAVYIDIDFLDTLPNREFNAGVAEIIKMAVMFDSNFFNFIENGDLYSREDLKMAITRSVKLKAWVVNQDEKEAGVRAVLNYGHTFAHVIENETEYKRFLHGEAVAIGMVMANLLSYEIDLISLNEIERIKKLLIKYSLPTEYRIEDIELFYNKFFLDKKSTNSKIKFILPKGIGRHEIRDNIEKNLIYKVLKRFSKVKRV